MPDKHQNLSESPTAHVLYDADYPRRPWVEVTRTPQDRIDHCAELFARHVGEDRSRRGPGARQTPTREIVPFLRRANHRR